MAADRFVLMQSWWLAGRLVRRHPHLTVIETHPHCPPGTGPSSADCLTVLRGKEPLVQINRSGNVHVDEGRGFRAVPTKQLLHLSHSRAEALVRGLESATGLPSPAHPVEMTPAALTYRAVAHLMAITINEPQHWDVRSVVIDRGGMDVGLNEHFLTPFPFALERTRVHRADDLYGNPLFRFWGVLRDGVPVAALDTDGFVYAGSQVMHLPDLYGSFAHRLAPTVATALAAVLP